MFERKIDAKWVREILTKLSIMETLYRNRVVFTCSIFIFLSFNPFYTAKCIHICIIYILLTYVYWIMGVFFLEYRYHHHQSFKVMRVPGDLIYPAEQNINRIEKQCSQCHLWQESILLHLCSFFNFVAHNTNFIVCLFIILLLQTASHLRC